MKQFIITIAIMLMPISAISLHAQENKHAQALHTTFIETIHSNFPPTVTAKWTPGKEDSTSNRPSAKARESSTEGS